CRECNAVVTFDFPWTFVQRQIIRNDKNLSRVSRDPDVKWNTRQDFPFMIGEKFYVQHRILHHTSESCFLNRYWPCTQPEKAKFQIQILAVRIKPQVKTVDLGASIVDVWEIDRCHQRICRLNEIDLHFRTV